MSLNKVFLLGNLGTDPELRYTQSQTPVCTLKMATNERRRGADGEWTDHTEWHTVVLQSDGLVGVAERYLRKGSKVYIEGSLRTRKWQDQSGNDRYSTEISVGGPGAVMTMLDGTARGGVLVAAAEKYGLPIHAIGVGEKVDDLRPFDAHEVARIIAGVEELTNG